MPDSRETRRRAIELLTGLSGARLQSFFFEFGLRDAYDELGQFNSRETRIHAALKEAERRGLLGQVLDESLHRFGDGGSDLRVTLAELDALISDVKNLPRDDSLSNGLQTKVGLTLENLFPGQGYAAIVEAIRWEASPRQQLQGVDAWARAQAVMLNVLVSARGDTISKGAKTLANEEATPGVEIQDQSRNVFLVHGRDTVARDAMAEFLRAISLWPLSWEEARQATGRPTPYIGDILQAGLAMSHATVVLFTGDDKAQLRQELAGPDEKAVELELMPQPRPNVLFEAGMAMGLNPDRTVITSMGSGLRPLSDLSGRYLVYMDGSPERRHELANRLKSCGCPVNTSGVDWLKAGSF